MPKIKLVCFDLDHTLIYDIHSVMYPCILNGKLQEVLEIEKKEECGALHWTEADYHRARLIEGLHVDCIEENFDSVLKPIRNIRETVDKLHKHKIQSVLITVGPTQVAEVAARKWGMDGYYGSHYEVVDNRFTGKILEYVGDKGKVNCLQDYCKQNGIASEACFAVGDGSTDIPVFQYCGASLAINYGESVLGKAKLYLKTDNLSDILAYIL